MEDVSDRPTQLRKSFSDIMRREGPVIDQNPEMEQNSGMDQTQVGNETVPVKPLEVSSEIPIAESPEELREGSTVESGENQDRMILMGTNLERDEMMEMPRSDNAMISESSGESVMRSVEEPEMGKHVRMLAEQAKAEQLGEDPVTLVGYQSDTLNEGLQGLDQFEGLDRLDKGDIEIVAKSLDEFKVEVKGDKELLAEELESLGLMVKENREKINDLEFIMESMNTMGAKKKDKKTKRKSNRRKRENRRKKTMEKKKTISKKKTRQRKNSTGKKKSKGKTKRR